MDQWAAEGKPSCRVTIPQEARQTLRTELIIHLPQIIIFSLLCQSWRLKDHLPRIITLPSEVQMKATAHLKVCLSSFQLYLVRRSARHQLNQNTGSSCACCTGLVTRVPPWDSQKKLDVAAHTCNPSISTVRWEAGAEELVEDTLTGPLA